MWLENVSYCVRVFWELGFSIADTLYSDMNSTVADKQEK